MDETEDVLEDDLLEEADIEANALEPSALNLTQDRIESPNYSENQDDMTQGIETTPAVHPLDWDCPQKLQWLVEGALFASQDPVTVKALQQLFPETCRPSVGELDVVISALQADYQYRAVNLQSTPLGYRFQIKQAATPLVRTMMTEKPPKYSRASLETLALIAYRQPITRGEIEEVRGVSVSTQILRTLEERGWVRIVGYKEVPGRPALWATTPAFLAYFGLNSLEELPPLAEIHMPEQQDSGSRHAQKPVEHATIPKEEVKSLETVEPGMSSKDTANAVDAVLEGNDSSPTTLGDDPALKSVFDRLRQQKNES